MKHNVIKETKKWQTVTDEWLCLQLRLKINKKAYQGSTHVFALKKADGTTYDLDHIDMLLMHNECYELLNRATVEGWGIGYSIPLLSD